MSDRDRRKRHNQSAGSSRNPPNQPPPGQSRQNRPPPPKSAPPTAGGSTQKLDKGKGKETVATPAVALAPQQEDPVEQLARTFRSEASAPGATVKAVLDTPNFVAYCQKGTTETEHGLLAIIRYCITHGSIAFLDFAIHDDSERFSLRESLKQSLIDNLVATGNPILTEIITNPAVQRNPASYDRRVSRVLELVFTTAWDTQSEKPENDRSEIWEEGEVWQYFTNCKMRFYLLEGTGSRLVEETPLQFTLTTSCLPLTTGVLCRYGASIRSMWLEDPFQRMPNLETFVFIPSNRGWAQLDGMFYAQFVGDLWSAESEKVRVEAMKAAEEAKKSGTYYEPLNNISEAEAVCRLWVNVMTSLIWKARDVNRPYVQNYFRREVRLSSARFHSVVHFLRARFGFNEPPKTKRDLQDLTGLIEVLEKLEREDLNRSSKKKH